ncbi:calcium-binding protein [Nitrincola sp. MINF-07-Sa-05]|uniref:calcium-binding protein n=1 Tax=Nitrincola salilacus TaxID=3400273 RepID=UPI0039184AF6
MQEREREFTRYLIEFVTSVNIFFGKLGVPGFNSDLYENTFFQIISNEWTVFKDGLISDFNNLFNSAQRQASPIILDLDGNGVSTTGITEGVYFDHNGDGFAQLTGWVDANDGLLVWDRNNNGVIDNGTELFGDNTVMLNGQNAVNGFAALAEHDTNDDGVIDANDAIWSELRIWRDLSQDGITREGELVTLDALGITSINLSYTDSDHVDQHGNAHKQVGSFTWADGTTGTATDVWFAVDPALTQEQDLVEVQETVMELPDLQGFGNVRSLHQAMARDESGELQALLTQFVTETDANVRKDLTQQIIFHWTGSAEVSAGSRGGLIDARKLVALEAFMGQAFSQSGSSSPRTQAANLLNQAFDLLQKTVYDYLIVQTDFKPYLDAITINFDENGLVFDFSDVEVKLDELRDLDSQSAIKFLMEFNTFTGSNLAELGWSGADKLISWIKEESAIDPELSHLNHPDILTGSGVLRGTSANNIILGRETDDDLHGVGGDNILMSGGGNNRFYGGTGNNLFVLGSGTDLAYSTGTGSNDTYRFGRGNGSNTIWDHGGTDRIELGEGIGEEQVVLRRVTGNRSGHYSGFRDDLRLTLDTGESLLIKDVFHYQTGAIYTDRIIEAIRFADGTEWDVARIQQELVRITEEGVTLSGSNSSDVIEVIGGNNVLYGGSGNDTLIGGEGNDKLYGQYGSNTLIAGGGNNQLHGGTGHNTFILGSGTDLAYSTGTSSNDTYRFGRGNGSNTIWDHGGTDRIELGEGIGEEQVVLRRVTGNRSGHYSGFRDDLRLTLDTGESLLIKDVFHYQTGAIYTDRIIEAIRFADGTEWDVARIQQELVRITEEGVTLSGSNSSDVIEVIGGNNVLYGGSGNDTLIGGEGNDKLYGQYGSNTLIAGGGNNQLHGGTGHNTFILGSGTDLAYSTGTSSNDTYRFGRGNGSNTIWDHGGTDRIELGEGIGEEQVVLRRVTGNRSGHYSGFRDDLRLTLDTGESLLIKDVFHYQTGAIYTDRIIEAIRFADGTEWDVARIQQELVRITEEGVTLSGSNSSDVIEVIGGNNVLYGGSGNDTLIGGEGNDKLYGQYGSNTLIAGGGNNQLHGGTGHNTFILGSGTDLAYSTGTSSNDTYRFGRGNGSNTIWDHGGTDRIELGEGIGEEQVVLRRVTGNRSGHYSGFRDDLRLTLDTGESLLIKDVFHYQTGAIYTDRIIEAIRFADGTEWDVARIQQELVRITEEGVTLSGSNSSDVIEVIGGNNVLYGGSGNDTLIGGEGNDKLYGQYGSNTLIAGGGNNQLHGGTGHNTFILGSGTDLAYSTGTSSNDTYRFGRGNGSNTIWDHGGSDRIELGEGIGEEQVVLRRVTGNRSGHYSGFRDDLRLTLDTGESLLIKDVFHYQTGAIYTDRIIEAIRFADGTEWDVARIQQELVRITEEGVTLSGSNSSDVIEVIGGNNVLYGGSGNDTLIGGEGNDKLYGQYGSNTLIAGGGNNQLHGGTGHNTFILGSGTDLAYSTGTSSNDTYRFGRGNGSNTIWDHGGSDRIELGEGIGEEQVVLRRVTGNRSGHYSGFRDDLRLTLDTGESLLIKDVFHYQTGAIYTDRIIEAIRFADGTEWDVARIQQELVRITEEGVTLSGSNSSDVIEVIGGNNVLYGGSGNDTLIGGEGNDKLYGQYGSNTLIAGGGNNQLHGGTGHNTFILGSGTDLAYSTGTSSNDTYRFGRGNGSNTIWDHGGTDRIELGEGIGEEQVVLRRVTGNRSGHYSGFRDDLRLTLDTGESLLIKDVFHYQTGAIYTDRIIEAIRFADGTEWDVARIQQELVRITEEGVTLSGSNSSDVIEVIGGNNVLYGGSGNDTLIGGEGNDKLYGQYGSNTLIAGGGNNQLHGGTGHNTFILGSGTDLAYSTGTSSNDTYRFGRGNGSNTIWDHGGSDRIELGEGIGEEQVVLRRVTGNRSGHYSGFRDDLRLTLDTGESLLIKDVFHYQTGAIYTDRIIEAIRFADGTEWDVARIQQELVRITEEGVTLSGSNSSDVIEVIGGNNVLYGGSGNDTLIGGEGNDKLYGQYGSNTLIAGGGNNQLHGGTGHNTFILGSGTDLAYSTGTSSNDTYRFGRGNGSNTIWDHGGTDRIELGEGIGEEQVVLRRVTGNRSGHYSGFRDDLRLTLDTGESLLIKDVFHYQTGAIYTDRIIEAIRFADGTEWDVARIQQELVRITEEGVTLSGSNSSDVIEVIGGNNVLYGGSGNDTLIGGEGNDKLYGQYGSNTLIAGGGNNQLHGGTGHNTFILGSGTDLAYSTGTSSNDTYRFGRGNGSNTIWDHGGTDRIELGEGIGEEQVVLRRVTGNRSGHYSGFRDDLRLTLDTGESLLIKDVFHYQTGAIYTDRIIEAIRFADGTEWGLEQIKEELVKIKTPVAPVNEDSENGVSETVVEAEAETEAAADDVSAESSSEEPESAVVTDSINTGDDTYAAGLNTGNLSIEDHGGEDTLEFSDNIVSDGLWFSRSGEDLLVDVLASDTRITIQNWYKDEQYQIEEFKAADGKVLMNNQVEALVSAMAEFSPPSEHSATIPDSYRDSLSSVITASWQ